MTELHDQKTLQMSQFFLSFQNLLRFVYPSNKEVKFDFLNSYQSCLI